MSRRIALLALAATIATAGTTVPAVAAQTAWPENCSVAAGPENSASAKCTKGGGQYQVTVACRSYITRDLDFYYGRWVGIGQLSLRFCPANSYRVFEGINTKAG